MYFEQHDVHQIGFCLGYGESDQARLISELVVRVEVKMAKSSNPRSRGRGVTIWP